MSDRMHEDFLQRQFDVMWDEIRRTPDEAARPAVTIRTMSRLFSELADPRDWDWVTWPGPEVRELTFASYDEWLAGGWNESPDVTPPPESKK